MTEATDAYEKIFTALAHPARRRILISINFAGGQMSAGEIASLFASAWPTTTRHLQILEGAGIIRHERRGRSRIYHMERERLALGRDWLAWFDCDPLTAKEIERSEKRDDTPPVQAQHRSR